MPELSVHDKSGKAVGKVSLPDELFAHPASDHLVWEVVNYYQANQRVGTANTKTREELRGGGRKPWRQKGTGRARVGSIRSPLWKGGGTVHGPTPRDYRVRLPKKKKKVALRRVLGDLIEEERLLVVEDLELDSHKTRDLLAFLEALGAPERTLLVDDQPATNLQRASRNVPGLETCRVQDLNVLDLLRQEHMTITREALGKLEESVS